jgi:hypothetical protein
MASPQAKGGNLGVVLFVDLMDAPTIRARRDRVVAI